MYVNECNNCGNYIHMGINYGSVCMYCGAQYECEGETSTYLAELIEECEAALFETDKQKAVALFDSCIERFPDVSRLYWGRFLACNACSSDKQLLSCGVDFENDPNYLNAIHFGDNSEQKCYEKLANSRKVMKDEIVKELQISERQEICDTGIREMHKSTREELDGLYDTLIVKMQALEDVERKIRDKKADCAVRIVSNQQLVNIALKKLEKKYSEMANQEEIETADFKRHEIEIERDAQLIESTGNLVKEFNKSDIFFEYIALIKERNDREDEVKSVMEIIEKINSKMNAMLINIEKIKKKYSEAIRKAETCSFSEATFLLGRDKMDRLLSRALQVKEV